MGYISYRTFLDTSNISKVRGFGVHINNVIFHIKTMYFVAVGILNELSRTVALFKCACEQLVHREEGLSFAKTLESHRFERPHCSIANECLYHFWEFLHKVRRGYSAN